MKNSISESQHSDSVQIKSFLEFSLENESYAVELLKVKEVIMTPELTPIPLVPHYVSGMMNLRGDLLNVIDLKKKLKMKVRSDSPQNVVIIFDLDGRIIGAKVDSIKRVINVLDDDIKDLPDEEKKSGHLLGVLQQENKLIMWIDPLVLFDVHFGSKKAA